MGGVTRGFTFTHDRLLEPSWKPGPGERYVDAPKAAMQVTRVTEFLVYFGYASGGGGGFSVGRAEFADRFVN